LTGATFEATFCPLIDCDFGSKGVCAVRHTPLNDNPIAELIGRYTLLREIVDALVSESAQAREQRERQEVRIEFLEQELAKLTRPRDLAANEGAITPDVMNLQSSN
jgi:hypothetical protein